MRISDQDAHLDVLEKSIPIDSGYVNYEYKGNESFKKDDVNISFRVRSTIIEHTNMGPNHFSKELYEFAIDNTKEYMIVEHEGMAYHYRKYVHLEDYVRLCKVKIWCYMAEKVKNDEKRKENGNPEEK